MQSFVLPASEGAYPIRCGCWRTRIEPAAVFSAFALSVCLTLCGAQGLKADLVKRLQQAKEAETLAQQVAQPEPAENVELAAADDGLEPAFDTAEPREAANGEAHEETPAELEATQLAEGSVPDAAEEVEEQAEAAEPEQQETAQQEEEQQEATEEEAPGEPAVQEEAAYEEPAEEVPAEEVQEDAMQEDTGAGEEPQEMVNTLLPVHPSSRRATVCPHGPFPIGTNLQQ